MPAPFDAPRNMHNIMSQLHSGRENNVNVIHGPLVVFNRDASARTDQPRDPWGVLFERDSKHANVLRVANSDNLPYLDLWLMWAAGGGATDTDSDFLTESSNDVKSVVSTTPIVRAFGRVYDLPAPSKSRQWPHDIDSSVFTFDEGDKWNNHNVMFRPLVEPDTDELAVELPISETGDGTPAMRYTVDGREFYSGFPRTFYTAGMADVMVTIERAAIIDTDPLGIGMVVGHFRG